MNQTAGATNAYRRCSKGGKVREARCRALLVLLVVKRNVGAELEGRSCVLTQRMLRKNAFFVTDHPKLALADIGTRSLGS